MEWKWWHILSNRSEPSGESRDIRIYSDNVVVLPVFFITVLSMILSPYQSIGYILWYLTILQEPAGESLFFRH